MDQIRESLLLDQAADRDDGWGCGRKIRAPESSEIQSVVNAMNAIRPIWKTPSQKLCRIIGFGNDQAGGIDKFIEADLEISWRENVVRVRGKAEANPKKLVDPKSGPRSEAGKVRLELKTSRSPARRYSAILSKRVCSMRPVVRSITSKRT